MDEREKAELRKMNKALNAWAFSKERTRRLSYKEAWCEAEKCKQRMKRFGHY